MLYIISIGVYLIICVIASFIGAFLEFLANRNFLENSFESAVINSRDTFFFLILPVIFYVPKLLFRKIHEGVIVALYTVCCILEAKFG